MHALNEVKFLMAKGFRATKISSVLFSLLIERSSYAKVYIAVVDCRYNMKFSSRM